MHYSLEYTVTCYNILYIQTAQFVVHNLNVRVAMTICRRPKYAHTRK